MAQTPLDSIGVTAIKQVIYQTRQYLQRTMDILSGEGVVVLFDRISLRIRRILGFGFPGNFDHGYARFLSKSRTSMEPDQVRCLVNEMKNPPGFSILLPVYNVEDRWLEKCFQSVLAQSYTNWQMCVVDDASTLSGTRSIIDQYAGEDSRISFATNPENRGIGATSQVALEMADRDYIVLLDHDDELAADALLHCAIEIDLDDSLDLIYSDEDKIDARGEFCTPFFKPDFSQTLLHGQNYIGHLVVARTSLVRAAGGFRPGFDGSQDYDLLLRLSEKTDRIRHIPKVLYHWREVPGSTALSFGSKSWAGDAGKRALESHLERTGHAATVSNGTDPGTYNIRFNIVGNPSASIILPFRDQPELLDKCLQSVFSRTSWQDFEIIAIDNNSELDRTEEVVRKWSQQESRIRIEKFEAPFNFSAICNFGVERSSGEYIILLNSDIELLTEGWVELLLEHAQLPRTGAVGAKLLFPDNTVQHAGIVVGIDGGAGHPYRNFPASHRGYFQRLRLAHNVSAVSAALLMVRRDKYLEVSGFDENEFAVAYNDVDFCLKLYEAGYCNALIPDCVATHHESATRGYELDDLRRDRHDREKENLRRRWPVYFNQGDPFYNPNLTLTREDYSLGFDRLADNASEP